MPIASLDDFRKKDEEDKKATQSYAGGEKSGLAIQNPADKDGEAGGSAGGSADQWEQMQQLASSSSGPLPSDHVRVTVYRNGFVVGDGPFRPISDPLNKKFMDEMAQGRCPSELQASGDQPVHVALTDKRGEDFKEPPPPAYVKFSGEGNSLGGTGSASSAAVQSDAGSVAVDAAKPKTKIQIRFHDGSRKAQEFNEDHTVGDLRAFCSQCVGGQAMTIMGGFPPKPITDDAQTLKAAGLCGSAVTARPA
uniref:SEP domain-containing protein n=1 Tax=Zooxanthella nutricula TaxID=1333877 RepID=A0A6U6UM77_9DINO|mmetsp:Transcript_85484/g.261432  ORF Transcript_85484/g.261432 Transcript_85484/m.261432 type:complete len:250 (+) Transcript_85484:107-856(+)